MGHNSEWDSKNPHRLHRYASVFTVLPRAGFLEKIFQILHVWLCSSVPHRKSWKCLPAVFPSIHSYTLWRLFLELYQQVCTYGFLLDGINNSCNNSWILLPSQVLLGSCCITKKSDSAEFAKIICLAILGIFVMVSWSSTSTRSYFQKVFNGSIIYFVNISKLIENYAKTYRILNSNDLFISVVFSNISIQSKSWIYQNRMC